MMQLLFRFLFRIRLVVDCLYDEKRRGPACMQAEPVLVRIKKRSPRECPTSQNSSKKTRKQGKMHVTREKKTKANNADGCKRQYDF